MKKELISVIVPIYNVEKYLRRCVESILNQTYQNLEVLLVNDGSTDRCAAICDEYGKKDKRIKVIHKENGGLSSARNVGINAATGEFLAFVDSDDFIEPGMIEKLYQAICSCNAVMAICNLCFVDEDGKKINSRPENIIGDECIGPMDYWERALEAYGWGMAYVVAWNKLYRKELWETLRYPVGKLNEDAFVIHKIVEQSERISCTSYVGYFYVQRAGSIMSQKRKKANFDLFEAWFKRIRYFCSIDREDFARKQLPQISEHLLEIYCLCKTIEEKNTYHRIVKKYDWLYRRFFQEIHAPLKECIKRVGCKQMPLLFGFVAAGYRAIWTKTWNWLHQNKGRKSS